MSILNFIEKHYEWLFSGLGITVVLSVWAVLTKPWRKKKEPNKTNNLSQNFFINGSNNQKSNEIETEKKEKLSKNDVRILFVDDEHAKYKMVSILKKAGWCNTKSVKDIVDLDDPKVKESSIIFVDINGVGTTVFKDQGLGLASALKAKYPQKKIVIYSGESKGDRFHKALREVDDCLPKNAEPYQFISLVEDLIS